MKISKNDALLWFEFFSQLPEDEEIMTKQLEIVYATFAQIEAAIDHRNDMLMSKIKGLNTLENRTFFVGNEKKFPQGCRSCLLGTGLSAIRKTNKCNLVDHIALRGQTKRVISPDFIHYRRNAA